MKVTTSHHIDKGDKDSQGQYEFHYEYDLYEFSENGICLTARSYSDEETEVHFIRKEVSGDQEMLSKSDLSTPLFSQAKEYLYREGKVQINYLCDSGYESVPNS